jgi:hypothetical protein
MFASVSELHRFYEDVAFIIWVVDFYILETIRFNIISLAFLIWNKQKKENSALLSIFKLSLQNTYFDYISFYVVGNCQTCLSPLIKCVLPRTTSTQLSSNDHNDIKRLQRKNVF